MTVQPKRIQLQRTKGWRLPEGAINCARPTRWGNPFRIGDPHPIFRWAMSREEVVSMYRALVEPHALLVATQLGGHDLACRCALTDCCHVDTLLQIANRPL